MRTLSLMVAAALVLAGCQDKPVEPLKPKVALSGIYRVAGDAGAANKADSLMAAYASHVRHIIRRVIQHNPVT